MKLRIWKHSPVLKTSGCCLCSFYWKSSGISGFGMTVFMSALLNVEDSCAGTGSDRTKGRRLVWRGTWLCTYFKLMIFNAVCGDVIFKGREWMFFLRGLLIEKQNLPVALPWFQKMLLIVCHFGDMRITAVAALGRAAWWGERRGSCCASSLAPRPLPGSLSEWDTSPCLLLSGEEMVCVLVLGEMQNTGLCKIQVILN